MTLTKSKHAERWPATLKLTMCAFGLALLLLTGCSRGVSVVIVNFRDDDVKLRVNDVVGGDETIHGRSSLVSKYLAASNDIEVLNAKSGQVLLKVKGSGYHEYLKNGRVLLLEVK